MPEKRVIGHLFEKPVFVHLSKTQVDLNRSMGDSPCYRTRNVAELCVLVPAAGNLETCCCVGDRWANREYEPRLCFRVVAEEIKNGKPSPSARPKLGSPCLKWSQVISATLAGIRS